MSEFLLTDGYWIWVDSLNVTVFTDSWSAKVPATFLVFSDVPYSSQSEVWYKSHEQLF